jgi:hypothetical protein
MEVRRFLLEVGIGLVPLATVIIGADGGYLVGIPPAPFAYTTNPGLFCDGGLLYPLAFVAALGLLSDPAWRLVGGGMLATLLAGFAIIPIACQVLPALAS